jgi:6,7-dimethyl-8-ribityllumazine synthase
MKRKVVCLVSRFNSEITERLLKGALKGLRSRGVSGTRVDVVKVPGAFELPIALQGALSTKRYAGAVVLSAIVKGGTDHDQYVAGALTDGILRLSLDHRVPVTYGVITAGTWRQALERSGGKHGNRGQDAALACLEMIEHLEKMKR